MAVRLFARGSDGVVAITQSAADEATFSAYISKPRKYIDKMHFHSNFDYMSLNNKFTATVNLPYRAKSTQTQTFSRSKGKGTSSVTYEIPTVGTDRYVLGYHGLGYVPFATASRGVNQVTPTAPIQSSGISQRLLNIEMTSDTIYVYENWVTYINPLDALTETFTVWVFRNPQ
jgi:hypothetical protein